MLNNLFTSLLASGRLKTTQTRGKELVRFGNTLIEKAKRGNLASQRSVSSHITNKEISKKFFKETLPRLASRNGGHIRLMKLGTRRGDGASMVLVELIAEDREQKADTRGQKKA